ncbi:hypothetical protein BU23DRAFT_7156 [Bimuria novae-zelandiae CBS 107.79]|uniref:Uncharacterized protein n=1 Tax=Bimuria novae-zelandiae CBS 107.79 TaxID=1447943 RepID=A0A6A5VUU8_9PLEO|nr:hypothetical protein BU23DRAFT_7156 [Bimuria novae-zelandiae CBS 107.79]
MHDKLYPNAHAKFADLDIVNQDASECSAAAPVIGIGSETVYRALSEYGSSANSEGEDMRSSFRLALSLVHEIAHTFYIMKQEEAGFAPFIEVKCAAKPRKRKGGKRRSTKKSVDRDMVHILHEPYVFATDPMPEIGLSWEHYVLGGHISPEARGIGGMGPMMLRPWEFNWTHIRVGLVVPMRAVEAWFDKSTW